MTSNLINKMPKIGQTIKYISKFSNIHQRHFSSLYQKSDDLKYMSFFAAKAPLSRCISYSNAPQSRLVQYLPPLSLVSNKGIHQKENSLGTNTLGIRKRLSTSVSFGDTKFSTRKLCTCSPPLMDPRGRVAVVTGATRGIGLSMVEELLCNGAKVFMIDVGKDVGECTATRLASIYGWENIQFAEGDVTCYESFEACVHLAACKFQRLDILVNNAGILTSCPREKIIDVNYKSVIFGTRLGFKYMGTDQGKEGGVVINVGSVVGLVGLPGTPTYSASKHAVIGATMSYGDCLTFDKTCVRVCAVCPGCTSTSMTTSIEDLPVEQFREGPGERTLLKDALNSLPQQPPTRLGPSTVYIIRYGPNGSVWVSEESELSQVVIPDYHDIECCNTRIKNLE